MSSIPNCGASDAVAKEIAVRMDEVAVKIPILRQRLVEGDEAVECSKRRKRGRWAFVQVDDLEAVAAVQLVHRGIDAS